MPSFSDPLFAGADAVNDDRIALYGFVKRIEQAAYRPGDTCEQKSCGHALCIASQEFWTQFQISRAILEESAE